MTGDPILARMLEDYEPEYRDDPTLHAALRGTYRYRTDALRAELVKLGDSVWGPFKWYVKRQLRKLDRTDQRVADERDAAISRYFRS